MKILDRYIVVEFTKTFAGILAVFVIVQMLRDVLSDLPEMLSKDPRMYHVLLYFVNRAPAQAVEVMPITAILAMMFSVGMMAKRKEILAMHASGISYLRLGVPLALVCACITLFVLLASEALVPRCEERARYLEKVEIAGKSESVLTRHRNITTKGKTGVFYAMKGFDSATNVMDQPTIFEMTEEGSGIKWRIDATSGTLVSRQRGLEGEEGQPTGSSEGEEGADLQDWRFFDAVRMTFDGNQNLLKRESSPELPVPMEEDLDRFLSTNKKPEEMNFPELQKYVRIQGERSKTTHEYLRRKTMLYNKLAFPLAVFILGMIGYTFAVRASIRSLVLEFGLALLGVFVYYALFAASRRVAELGVAPPLVASWYANALFIVLLAWRFWALEKVPRH